MRFGVVRFPGSNCDDDALHVVDRVLASLGSAGQFIWHKDRAIPDVDAIIVPGGFTYGDYLRTGAMAAHSPIMSAVAEFARSGAPVLGICNGFQILCEAGLLDGALLANASLKFVCRDVHCIVEGRPTPFTQAIPAGRHIKMNVAHHGGRYVHPEVERLEREGRVVFRYADDAGTVTDVANPNGSQNNIAGICNEAGNVVGLMPHPERACESVLGGGTEDGRSVFESAIAHLRGTPSRVGGNR
jgi:phosphoribosylformylglycinamidine synthase subunit PurQ / glutaminase